MRTGSCLGNFAAATLIDARQIDRVIDVHPSAANVHLEQLAITGGLLDGNDYDGAGVRTWPGTTNADFSNG